ncbi:MAG: nodulation protein NfeD [Leptospirillia bacterium]
MQVRLEGVIGPASADILDGAIADAEAAGAEALLVLLDTPGGLDDAMRRMIKAMLASEVPVIVYVSPDGARAASAGVFILYAAHVSAMASGTNLGAAHPVAMGGGEMDETLMAKATNDAVAYIRSLANMRERNAEWAEQAVRESVSITAHEAVEAGVVDLLADDRSALLAAIDGRQVETALGTQVLATATADVTEVEVPWSMQILALLTNPNVAYILMMLGTYGMIYELANPGLILPGIVGAICLILALYAFSVLPVSYAGVALILLAAVLFVSEIMVSGFGLLAGGGVIALALGSMMLMDTNVPFLQVSMEVLVPVLAFGALFAVLATVMAIRAHRHRPVSGEEGMIGTVLHLDHALSPEGQVHLGGELWNARAPRPLAAGTRVRLTGFDGLTALVQPEEAAGENGAPGEATEHTAESEHG